MRKKTTKYRFEEAAYVSNGSNSRFKRPRIKRKKARNTPTSLKAKKRSYAKLEAKAEVSEGNLVWVLPIKTISEANCFEHWRLKHKRHKEQQRIVAYYLKPWRDEIKLPCKIMLTRFAPNELDVFDNLPMSLKYIVDAICALITGNYIAGKADSDKRISIACDQVKSKAYGIRIEITF